MLKRQYTSTNQYHLRSIQYHKWIYWMFWRWPWLVETCCLINAPNIKTIVL